MKQRSLFSIIQLVLSFAGFVIAATLYYAHSHNIDLPCSTGNGCDLVNASRWAHIGPIPVSFLGAVGYAVLAFAAVIKLTADKENVVRGARVLILIMTTGGFIYSWYLQYVAHVYIGAFCIYCRSSALVMTALFLSVLTESALTARRASLPTVNQPIA